MSCSDIICTLQVLICLGMQIFHVPVNNFSKRHTLLKELILEHVQAMLYLCLLDIIVDLAFNKLANHAYLYALLAHLLCHV